VAGAVLPCGIGSPLRQDSRVRSAAVPEILVAPDSRLVGDTPDEIPTELAHLVFEGAQTISVGYVWTAARMDGADVRARAGRCVVKDLHYASFGTREKSPDRRGLGTTAPARDAQKGSKSPEDYAKEPRTSSESAAHFASISPLFAGGSSSGKPIASRCAR
jgi:hypothetical protein